MATTNIELDIENITSVTDANDQFIISAQKFIVSSIPKNLLTFAQKASSASTDGSAISFSVNDSIIDIQRNGYSCREIPMSEAIWALDSSSLKFATAKYPVWYHKQGAVHFAPVTSGSGAGYIFYIDYSLIDDNSDLRSSVIYRASAMEFSKLASDLIPSWTSPSLPVAPVSPDFGNDLTISSSAPAKPVIIQSSVDTSGWTEPTYSKPASPVFTTITINESSLTAPTFTPPVMSAPDFSDTNTWISTEEDSEMLDARVKEIQAKIGEYGAKMQESQGQFSKENAEYQAELQIALQNAQLDLQNNVQKLQVYTADLQNEQAEFNKEVQIYQAQIQASIQDAQLDSAEDAQKIQKYGAELQEYQNEINKEVQDFVNTLNKEVQEYQSKVAKYGAELQSYQGEIAEQTAEKGIIQKNISYYAQQSEKYYQWAQMEVVQYIQNNSKMINKTMAAQAAQQRR
tara:strand:+ start:7 stop:1380 length:1374 start_codon:yes stop_codon:yes gene_type:complete